MKKIFVLMLLMLAGGSLVWAQTRQVTGKVTDENGDPLSGVSIVIKGTTTGVQSGSDGKFSISVPQGKDALEISYTGYKTVTMATAGKQNLAVKMEANAISLDDVVVVGYQTVKRKDLTGSVSSVDAKQLKDIPINSAEQALAGRLAGVQVTGAEGSPDAQVSIRVRGGGSITQDNAPLYVVDGITVDNALSNLSPQDIESIDVLKDASATAIYGSRGANGVVIITTKGGNKGRTSVNYNGFVGVQKVAKTLDVLDPYDFVVYQYERTRGSSQNEKTFLENYGTWDDLSNYKDAPFADWQEQVFGRAAMMQTHNASVSGGDAKTQFNLSLTANKNEAVMLNSDYDRKLINFKLTHKASDKFNIGFNLRFNRQKVNGAGTSSPGSSGLNFLRQAVRYIPFLPAGQSISYYDPQLLTETSGNGLYIVNPLLLINSQYRRQYQTVVGVSGFAEYKFNKFLSFRTTVGYDYNSKLDNKYDDSLTSNAISNGNGMPIATIGTSEKLTFNNSNVFTFDNSKLDGDFNHDNRITAILGQETYQVNNKSGQTIQRYFPFGTTAEKALANLNLASPPAGYAQPAPTSYQDVQRIASFFTRVNYSYKDKYLASFSVRADGSTLFAEGLQWGYFPSGSLAWRISQEDFMENLAPAISDMKLRVDYGEAGNNRIDPFLYLTQFETGSNYYGLQNQLVTAFGSVSLANALLTWESMVSRGIGLDVSFLNNRIQFSADYYRNKTRNLLVSVPVPTTSGYETQIQNVGATSNNGFEIQLGGTIIQNKKFTWAANFNISFNQNKVLDLGRQSFFLQGSGWAGSNNPDDYIVKVGEPVGSMYGLINDGYYTIDDFDYDATTQAYTLKDGVVDNSGITALAPQPGIIKYKDITGDGIVNSEDRTIIGNANPKFFGGLNQQFSYGNFDMSIFLNFVYGNDIYNDNKLEFSSGYTMNANLLAITNNRWRTINDMGEVVTDPKALAALNENATLWRPVTTSGAFYPQSFAVEDGSFLRVNNVTVGYTLPRPIAHTLHVQNFRAYVTVNNLAVLTNYSGYDPEVNTRRSTPMTPGVDFSAYPRARSFIAGVNVSF